MSDDENVWQQYRRAKPEKAELQDRVMVSVLNWARRRKAGAVWAKFRTARTSTPTDGRGVFIAIKEAHSQTGYRQSRRRKEPFGRNSERREHQHQRMAVVCSSQSRKRTVKKVSANESRGLEIGTALKKQEYDAVRVKVGSLSQQTYNDIYQPNQGSTGTGSGATPYYGVWASQ